MLRDYILNKLINFREEFYVRKEVTANRTEKTNH